MEPARQTDGGSNQGQPLRRAVYKGCTLVQTEFGTFLYVTNFKSGQIEVYDSKFQRVHALDHSFRNGHLPHDFVPFNIQNIGGSIVVTFAKREPEATMKSMVLASASLPFSILLGNSFVAWIMDRS